MEINKNIQNLKYKFWLYFGREASIKYMRRVLEHNFIKIQSDSIYDFRENVDLTKLGR